MIEVEISFYLPGSHPEPKGNYWFEHLWTDPGNRFLKEENAIYIMKKLVRRVPMGSWFRVQYRCPMTGDDEYFDADRKSIVGRLEQLRDSILSGVPVF